MDNRNQITTEAAAPKKEDRRVRRTKMLLTRALTTLMNQKRINEISVKELTDLADINRGTFYLYYKDIHDMLAKIENHMFTSMEGIIAKYDPQELLNDIKPILTDILQYIYDNREVCAVLLSPNGDMQFLARLDSLLRESFRGYWHKRVSNDDVEYDYFYSFCVFGCAGLIRSWLSHGCREDSKTLACLAERMLLSGSLNTDGK